MKRLTTDNPKTRMQFILNLFTYTLGENNNEVMYLPKGDPDRMTLCDLIRMTSRKLGIPILYEGAEDTVYNISEFLGDSLNFDYVDVGIHSLESLLGYFYTTAWAFADLRERLKQYEDTEFTPEEITEMRDKLILANDELLKLREENKTECGRELGKNK